MLCEQNTLIEKNASLTFARRLKYTMLCNCEIETDTCACNKHNHLHPFCVLSFYVFFEKYRFQASTELRAHALSAFGLRSSCIATHIPIKITLL